MKNVTIKSMINNSNIPASLIRAVVRQFGGFEAFEEVAQDVTNHGIQGGFHRFIYYTDTLKFYAANQRAIVDYAAELAVDFGQSTVEMVRAFNCLDATDGEVGATIYGTKRQYDTQVANALAWFAGEEVCRLYCDLLEQ